MAQKEQNRRIIAPSKGVPRKTRFRHRPDASFCRACRIKDLGMIHLRILTYLRMALCSVDFFLKSPQTMDSVSATCPPNFETLWGGSNFESRLDIFVWFEKFVTHIKLMHKCIQIYFQTFLLTNKKFRLQFQKSFLKCNSNNKSLFHWFFKNKSQLATRQ